MVAGLLVQVVLVLRISAVHRVLERFRVLVEVSRVRRHGLRGVLRRALATHVVHDTRERGHPGPVIAATAVGAAT